MSVHDLITIVIFNLSPICNGIDIYAQCTITTFKCIVRWSLKLDPFDFSADQNVNLMFAFYVNFKNRCEIWCTPNNTHTNEVLSVYLCFYNHFKNLSLLISQSLYEHTVIHITLVYEASLNALCTFYKLNAYIQITLFSRYNLGSIVGGSTGNHHSSFNIPTLVSFIDLYLYNLIVAAK
jgi:hypothetical protein